MALVCGAPRLFPVVPWLRAFEVFGPGDPPAPLTNYQDACRLAAVEARFGSLEEWLGNKSLGHADAARIIYEQNSVYINPFL